MSEYQYYEFLLVDAVRGSRIPCTMPLDVTT
ncbi:hypothetical protein FraQA3DRAFT_6113 [Frankia sp. QA3]|nr:hypothetical protein FraQA3DRAFT_6113 [Frankia sp. QA3]